MSDKPVPGTIGWHDLTVPDASGLKQFYEQVVGWRATGHPMGDYEDFVLMPAASDEPVGGLCHARGVNLGIPPQWLMYVHVDDIEAAVARAGAEGGAVAVPVREAGGGKMAVLADPSGALFALYQGP